MGGSMKIHMLWMAMLMTGAIALVPLYAEDAAPPADAAEPAAEAPAAPESAEDFQRRVAGELDQMDNEVDQQRRRAGDLTAEQKGALTTYKERKKVVVERLKTVDSADAAQTDSAKASVEASL